MESATFKEAVIAMGTDGFLREVFYQTDGPETFLELMRTPRAHWIEIMSSSIDKVTTDSIEGVKQRLLRDRKSVGLQTNPYISLFFY